MKLQQALVVTADLARTSGGKGAFVRSFWDPMSKAIENDSPRCVKTGASMSELLQIEPVAARMRNRRSS